MTSIVPPTPAAASEASPVGATDAHPAARPVRAPRLADRAGAFAGGAAALTGGVATGVAGSGVHQVVVAWGGVRWPVGVVLALVLLLAFAGCVRAASSGMVPTLLVAGGWLAVTGLGTLGSRGGDVIVPENWRGTGWVLGGAVVLVAVLVRGPGARR